MPVDNEAWELYVNSPQFDRECDMHSVAITKGHPYDDNDFDFPSDNSLWEDSSSASSVGSSHDVPKLEAYLYYFGLRGTRRRGPKLIFRTSSDVFTAPSGPGRDRRVMWLRPVYEHHQLGKDDLWANIRYKVVELLDKQDIQFSSVDLVRFSWVKEDEDVEEDEDVGEDEGIGEDEDIEENEGVEGNEDIEDADILKLLDVGIVGAPYGTVITTPVTIWVGVLPNTLSGDVAFHSSNDILGLLKEHGITDVDVAFRESVVRDLSGPELFAPVSEFDPLEAIIDPVTTALGLPIAGLQTLTTEGTMGFYFRAGEELYAVTARHVLFPKDEGNKLYTYIAGPKKEVVLMGIRSFDKFYTSILGRIGDMNAEVGVLERQVTMLEETFQGGGPDADKMAGMLKQTRRELGKTRTAIPKLKKFFVKVTMQWVKPSDRVIGHVVWAPISVAPTPHGYTKDVCVVKLDEKKFSQNFRGNVLDLGPEIDLSRFINLMCPRIDARPGSVFTYPFDRLLQLGGISSAEEIRSPNSSDRQDDLVRYVIKRGLATLTTVGCLNGYESHTRRYFGLNSLDSVEVAVCPHDYDLIPFSKVGDSGSIIVDADGKFVALLTAGTGSTHSSDITFASPMHWLWDVIKAEFPGANLCLEGDD